MAELRVALAPSNEAEHTTPRKAKGKSETLEQRAGEGGHRRLAPLDGLRALAIGSVIASHEGFFGMGFAGVQLFFVLSGFLITGILRHGRGEAHFWKKFYLKRATRILPPLVPFFLMCVPLTTFPHKMLWLAFVFFGANIASSFQSVPTTYLTVMWSLAVEEHFYLVWPFGIRFMRRRKLAIVLGAVVALEPVARGMATLWIGRWKPIYFLTPFQLDGLALGSLLAIVAEEGDWRQWLRRNAGRFALGGVVTLGLLLRRNDFLPDYNTVLFNGVGYSLIVWTCMFVLAHVVTRPHSWFARFLSLKPLVFVGLISYGLYLYVGPVQELVMRGGHAAGCYRGRLLKVVGLAVAVLLSWISFRFYESPLVAWGRRRAAALGSHAGAHAGARG